MLEIAIVGIGCRFPGGIHDPAEFWEFLLRKGDGIVEVPADRWSLNRYYDPDPDAPGRMYTRHGGFLTDPLWDFDPEFFGISPREASIMDPQQRLLLEVAVEALDDAGQAPRVGGGEVGVYVGGFTSDNMAARHSPGARAAINSHTPTSGSFTMLSNRLSYVLDLHGPSMTIDTACSSSLVAIHEAAQAIARGECTMALAGGTNAMFQPETFISMCKGRFLSPDGHCKSFDAAADGYGRGEGAGVVVLRPLADAIADGDRVYAVIRATGANQDGRTSGITVPNPVAQEALARRVVAQARINPAAIGYVEAHGTGTSIGDPLEISALGAVYGTALGRSTPLIVGSVKNSIGHTEAAAGVAGVIKAALTVYHRTIAPQARLDTLNPEIPFDRLNIAVPVEAEPFPAGYAVAAAAVNGFGYGGTNAHVVLVEPPAATAARRVVATGTRVFPVSGRTEAAVREVARSYVDLLERGGNTTVDAVCDAAWTRRTQHPFRAAVTYRDQAELVDRLRAISDGSARAGSRTVVRDGDRPVFVFTGMGPQWWRMARDLLEAGGAFAATAREIDDAFRPIAGWSIIEELLAPEETSRIGSTAVAQPANFLVQLALCAELAAAGVSPAAVLGHSVGEVSAAYVSGTLSLRDALLVSYHRARLQATTAGTGGLLAVGLPESEVPAWLAPGSRVDVAAVNSPSSVTLAGDVAELEELTGRLTDGGVFARALRVEVPYHSHLMDWILPEIATVLADVRPTPPTVPLYSSVTAARVEGATWDAAYWCDNVRRPVRFADAVTALVGDGHRVFVEIGPHPVLGGNIREILVRSGETGATVATLHRDKPDQDAIAGALGDLYAAGCLSSVRPGGRNGAVGGHIDLPAYPWQRTRLWAEEDERVRDRLGSAGIRPLLGERAASDAPEWEAHLSSTTLPWLAEHVVDGVVVLPGAAFLDAALCAAAELTRGEGQSLEAVQFLAPLVVDDHDVPVLRVSVEPSTNRVRIHSRPAASPDWTLNAVARVVDGRFTPGHHDFGPPHGAEPVSGTDLYPVLASRGLRYGPSFQGIVEAWVDQDSAVARVDPGVATGAGHLAHPAVVDAALQCVAALVAAAPDAPGGAVVPAAIRSVRRFGPVPDQVRVLVRRLPAEGMWADIAIGDEDGNVAIELHGVEFRPVRPADPVRSRVAGMFYELGWEPRDSRDAALVDDAAEATVVVSVGASPSPLVETIAAGRTHVRHVELAGDAAATLGGHGTDAVADAVRSALREPGLDRVLVAVVAGPGEAPGTDAVAGLIGTASAVQSALDSALFDPAAGRAVEIAGGVAPRAIRPVRGVVVTERAFGLPGDRELPDLAHAGLIGARRTLRNEQPACHWRLVDVDGGIEPEHLLAEIAVSGPYADDDTDEVALRDGVRMVVQLHRNLVETHEELSRPRPMIDPERNYRLEVPRTHLMSELGLREIARTAPGPGQIEVATASVGVSYKDALKVTGVLTSVQLDGTYFGTELGMEAQGTVVRVGPGVDRFAVGDRVGIGARNVMARYLTLDVDGDGVVRHAPAVWSDTGCTSIVVFLTAHYSLIEAARLRAGETVLVHGAAGGVGLAGVQVAKRLGARVIGTAGTPERRAHVLAAGADEVLDSRSLNFVQDVLDLTGGRGVDVVLSSAPGEVLPANLAVAAEFGRIVEVGKTGIYGHGVIDLAPFDRNLTFVAIDVDRMFALRRDMFVALVDAVIEGFDLGLYTELPTTTFPVSRAAEALECVARSHQVGRVALTFDEDEPLVMPEQPHCHVDGRATYLITGGFGDFGLATARWLVGCGARHLALVGRRGATTDAAKSQLAAFAEDGIEVAELTADVASLAEVTALIGTVDASMPPLRGVFHAAGVLDDRPFTDIDAASLRSVMDPKARGAWNLHRALEGHDLDHFVVYSSAAAITGNIPQAAYAAANTVLDSLAALRRAQGLPALTVSWGALAGGMAESSEEIVRYLEMIGLASIDMELATAALGEALAVGVVHAGVLDVDWTRWGATHPASAGTPRFAAHIAAAGTGGSQAAHLRAELAKLPEEQRVEVLGYVLAEQLAEVLGIPADALDLATPLPDLGLDSLMAVDLGARVNLALGVEVSALEFSRGLGLAGLARKVLPMLVPTKVEA